MKWIGLTGGIACGKSTVSRKLSEGSIPVIDADAVAREVVQKGSTGLKSVVQFFGESILQSDGNLDRRKLGQMVFGHPELLRKLESITHPLIKDEVLRRRQELERQGQAMAIYDVPLLFETQMQDQFDLIIVVSCSPEQQRQRLRQRNGLSEKEIDERLSSQMDLRLKEQQADFIIHNDRDEGHLEEEMKRLRAWLDKVSI